MNGDAVGAGTELRTELADGRLTVTFDRPAARNAMTWAMYEGLHAACERADDDPAVRVLVLRGAGDRAFVAGTDIGQFAEFRTGPEGGADGVAYEAAITRVVNRLEEVTVPTLAVVRGACVGAGIALAAACDLRVADSTARFGVPIARTLGNCLSANSTSLLVHHLGPGPTLDLLLRGRLLGAADAHAAGFLAELTEPGELDATADAVAAELADRAPLTQWAAKELVRRMRRALLVEDDDVVATVFGSEDFAAGVRAFGTAERPRWTGR